jgi:hypothetical protein
MVEVPEFLDRNGHSPFGAWCDHLNREAAAKVAAALARLQQGNFSNAKGVLFTCIALISVRVTAFTLARMVTVS